MSHFAKASAHRKMRLLFSYIAFLFLWAVSFAIMPFSIDSLGDPTALLYVAGILFWLGAIGTIISALCINRSRIKNRSFMEEHGTLHRFGLIHFFQNTPAKIADVFTGLTLLGMVASFLWIGTNLASFLCVALFVLSFGMHCMLNGINYFYITFRKERNKQ